MELSKKKMNNLRNLQGMGIFRQLLFIQFNTDSKLGICILKLYLLSFTWYFICDNILYLYKVMKERR